MVERNCIGPRAWAQPSGIVASGMRAVPFVPSSGGPRIGGRTSPVAGSTRPAPWPDSTKPIAPSTCHGSPGHVAAASMYTGSSVLGISSSATAVGVPASRPGPTANMARLRTKATSPATAARNSFMVGVPPVGSVTPTEGGLTAPNAPGIRDDCVAPEVLRPPSGSEANSPGPPSNCHRSRSGGAASVRHPTGERLATDEPVWSGRPRPSEE